MRRLATVLLLIVGMATFASAQNLSPEIKAVAKKVEGAFDENLKGWTREGPIVPAYPGENVFIAFWRTNDRTVKIAISPLRKDYKPGNLSLTPAPDQKSVEGIGDEAIAYGRGDGIVWFVRDRFYVSVSSDVHLNLFSRTKEENETLSLLEAGATSKLMACFVDQVLRGALDRDKPPPRDFFKSRCVGDLLFKGLLGERIQRQVMTRQGRLKRTNPREHFAHAGLINTGCYYRIVFTGGACLVGSFTGFFSLAITSAMPRSSCGSRPAISAAGSLSTSMSGSTP